MSNIVNQIGYAMSLREPQKEALQYSKINREVN